MNASAHGTLIAVTHSGVGWIGEVFRFALVALAAGMILGLQYFRRKTVMARFLVIAFGLLLLTSQFLPWRPAFAIEERLSPKPGAGAGTEVTFDQVRGKFKSPSGLVGFLREQPAPWRAEDNAEVFLPLQIAGVRNDAILLADRVEVHVIGQDGRVIYHGTGDNFEVAREGAEAPRSTRLPENCSADERCTAVRRIDLCKFRVDYSLTLFGLARSYSLPALDGAERMPGVGLVQDENE